MQGQVGIIGIGLLGKALSDCLACAGFEIYGYDIAQTQSGSVHLFPSASAVFEQCDTVFLSLPNSNVVASVIDDVIDVIAARHCILDTTTGDPEQIEALGVRLAKKGASYLEANVAGSSVQMRERKAVLLLGGEADVVAAQEPIFSTLAKKRFHVGGVGAGAREALAADHAMRFAAPPPRLCTDNAAMIAWAGIERLGHSLVDGLDAAPRARWPLDVDAPRPLGAGRSGRLGPKA